MKPLLLAAILAATFGASASSRNNLVARPFGKLADGRSTVLYTLRSRGGAIAEISNYGAKLVRMYVPDRNGNLADVALGWNTAAEYEKYGFSMGTVIGRYANRIADGRFTLDGRAWQLAVNETNPPPRHCNLHSGPLGWDCQIWKARAVGVPQAEALELTYVSPDGDMGFPGKVTCKVTYKLDSNNVLSIDYEATTDKPTVLNLTHHGYWNLAGEASGSVLGQELQVCADRYTRTTPGLIPLRDEPVEGTGFDFRELRPIGAKAKWMAGAKFLACTDNWYDHNFPLRGKPGEMKMAAMMRDPVSGRAMEIWTTEPCMQMYGAQNMDGTLPAKESGKKLVRYAGVALETQHYPDSPNHPEFPTTVLRPGETFRSHTEYRFAAE